MIILKSINHVHNKLGEASENTSENILSYTETSMNNSDYLVAFSGATASYCVGLVDMVDSTKISAKLSVAELGKYYQLFLNTMAKTLSRYGGQVIKNIGDSLLFYFPESSKNRTFGFMSCIEGALAMIEMHDLICICAKKEGLPCINYRVSCDYGPVVIMKPNDDSIDMIGPPVNMCAKINHVAFDNEIIMGGDLHQMAKNIPDYKFTFAKDFDSSLKQKYSLYKVARR